MKFNLFLAILLGVGNLSAQTLTLQQALELAEKNYPALKISAAGVTQRKALERTAFNLPNPEIMVESPTGTFYTPGVSQTFALPGVYSRRKKLLQAETERARRESLASENELRRSVRSAYLEVQIAQAAVIQVHIQDSLLQQLAAAAAKLYEGGQINALEQIQARNRAAEAANAEQEARQDLELSLQNLRFFTGQVSVSQVDDLKKSTDIAGIRDVSANPQLQILEQELAVKIREQALQKTAALPEITLGYLNQGERNTPVDYRFRAGLNLPLWYGQYRGASEAARIEHEKTAMQLDFTQATLRQNMDHQSINLSKWAASVAFFENRALPNTTTLMETSAKLFNGGEIDVVSHLRTLAEAFALQSSYIEALRNYNQTIIEIEFLNGK